MKTIIEQLEEWKAEGGPALWTAAWDRTIELGRKPWAGKGMNIDGPVLADGAAALTIIFYVTAVTERILPREVTRAHVDAFSEAVASRGEITKAQPGIEDYLLGAEGYWVERLTAVGHDVADQNDPVAVRWQQISIRYKPPHGSPDEVWEDMFTRWGPGYSSGLLKVFAPAYTITLD